MSVKWRYWRRKWRVMPVTFHLITDIHVEWTAFAGVEVVVGQRAWFIGAVESRAVRSPEEALKEITRV